jgi:hypothetical protein
MQAGLQNGLRSSNLRVSAGDACLLRCAPIRCLGGAMEEIVGGSSSGSSRNAQYPTAAFGACVCGGVGSGIRSTSE